jgi:TetR/AcrR family transcriptional regulator of autoinduction and epiphytic fitness
MPTLAPTRLTDRKRSAILAAAAVEFRAHGFEMTSMDKIAANAGVSKRTVYNHFPSKDELFAETLIALFTDGASKVDLAYQSGRPLRAQLSELLTQKLALLADRNFLDLARVAIAEAIVAPERARPIIARLGEREDGVLLWIRAAQADGKLKPGDPLFAATLLQGQVKAVAFWPQVTMGAPPLAPELAPLLVEAAVEMFLAYFATGGD